MMKVLWFALCLAVGQVRALAVTAQPELFSDSTDETTMGHDDGGDGDGGHDMSMKMYFHHTSHATILFEGWHTMTYWDLFGSCLAVMVMAALYEGYKTLRENILRSMTASYGSRPSSVNKTAPITEELTIQEKPDDRSKSVGLCDSAHLVQGLLHIGQVFISYCLMLVFMTYNIWLCIALCLGAGLGYWLFARKRSVAAVDPNEHCN